jgi:hypothetical protein
MSMVFFVGTSRKEQILERSLKKILPLHRKNLIIDQENALATGHPMKCSGFGHLIVKQGLAVVEVCKTAHEPHIF